MNTYKSKLARGTIAGVIIAGMIVAVLVALPYFSRAAKNMLLNLGMYGLDGAAGFTMQVGGNPVVLTFSSFIIIAGFIAIGAGLGLAVSAYVSQDDEMVNYTTNKERARLAQQHTDEAEAARSLAADREQMNREATGQGPKEYGF